MPFLILTLISALLISLVVGFFSISGLVAIFPDATIPIVCLGIVLEIAKLVTASFVYKHWDTAKTLARGYLLVAVIVLSCITSVGVFGYLSKTNLAGNAQIGTGQDKIAFVQKSIDAQVGNIKAESTAVAQMDKVMNNYLLDTSKVATAEKIRNNQAKERQRSKDKIDQANKSILSLQLQKDSLSNIQRVNEIHVGPLKYLAELFGMSAEKMVRWFILIIVFVCDPLALCLVIGANIQAKSLKHALPDWVQTNNDKQRQRIEDKANHEGEFAIDRPVQRLLDPNAPTTTQAPSSDFGFTDPPSRPIIQVIHP